MLALSLYKIVEFINLEDDCNIEDEGNELYNAISEKISINKNDSEKILSKFLGDVVLNIIQEYTDTKWLIQIGKNNMYLQNKLAEQKETEKQELLKKKDGMTSDQRLVNKLLEQTGVTNLFKDSEKYYQEMVEQYDNSFEEDVVAEKIDNGYYDANDFNADDGGEDTMDDNDLQPIDDHFED